MCTPGAGPTLMTQTPAGDNISMPLPQPKLSLPDSDASARLALTTQSLGAVTSAAGAFAKASAERSSALMNASIANGQALNAQRIGDSTAQRLYAQTNQLKGTQRATMAASGVSLASGSPLDILTSTDVMGAADQATNKINTQLDVNAALDKAAYFKSQASNASPFIGGATSLIGGAGKVADRWYDFKKAGNFAGG